MRPDRTHLTPFSDQSLRYCAARGTEAVRLSAPLDGRFEQVALPVAETAGLTDTTRFIAVARWALSSAPVKHAAVRKHWQ